ncbi:MAG: hypothetical protein ACLFUE_01515 [Desulfobacteraceae bacterium]
MFNVIKEGLWVDKQDCVASAEQMIEHVQKQMRMFTLLLRSIGSISLVVDGVGVSYAIARYSGWGFSVISQAVFLGVGVSAAVGMFFWVLPGQAGRESRSYTGPALGLVRAQGLKDIQGMAAPGLPPTASW